ncbi:hypothetical protein, partial [Enterobacter hormaechei]|uniref:hypothetical protein n=1 Tax=Enterobacter hormaechei TaxID=158836 RepID=UPI001F0A4760
RLFGDYSGTWGFIRWLEQGKRHPLDRSQWMMSFSAPDGRTLQWVLRSQLGSGPLALLALRLFGDYSGTWGFIRWLEQGKRHPLDRSQWMMS